MPKPTQEQLKEACKVLLSYAEGDRAGREGLLETPDRFAKAWGDLTSGYGQEPNDVLKTFGDGAEGYNQMVYQRNIVVWSLCEHHLAPFFGVAHIAYIPNGRVVGLSKLTRLTRIFMRRLQVQERLTQEIADALNEGLKPLGVAVALKCRHSCMESRGVCEHGTETHTVALHGVFHTDAAAKAEFMALVNAP